jgi:alpha-L-rhamnosidase
MSILTDCPNRDERLGWTDISFFSTTGVYLFNTDQFYSKWLQDLRSYQMNEETSDRDKGLVPVVIPAIRKNGLQDFCNFWGDAAVCVPWNLYQQYGDTRIISDAYDSMKAWCDFLNSPTRSQDFIRIDNAPRDNKYGDKLSIQNSPESMMNTLATAYSNKLFSKMAQVVGKKRRC